MAKQIRMTGRRNIKSSKYSLPTRVPVLSPKDICQGSFVEEGEDSTTRCMLGWIREVYPAHTRGAVTRVCGKMLAELDGADPNNIPNWNDTQATTRRIANRFNTLSAALGYTTNNPMRKQGLRMRKKLEKSVVFRRLIGKAQ